MRTVIQSDEMVSTDGSTAGGTGWRRVRFGDVVRLVNENEPNPLEAGLERYVGLEHIDPESLHIKHWGLIEEGTSFTRKFEAGQVLFGKRRAYQRKVAVAEWDGICSGDILVFEANPNYLLRELLPFIVQSDGFFEQALSTSAGSLSPRTKWQDLARYEFTLPPKDEQRQIAEMLWAADEAHEHHIRVCQEIEAYGRAVWAERVANCSWKKEMLGDIAEISNGTTPSREIESYWINGTVPWLPTGKVHDRIISQADEYITLEALESTSLKLLPPGTVLVAMIGQGKTRGTAAYLNIEASINQNFAAIVAQQEVDSQYLFYCLDNSYEELRRFSQGSNQGALSCRVLQKFPIPLPPLHIQREVAAVLIDWEAGLNCAKSHVIQLQTLTKDIREVLL